MLSSTDAVIKVFHADKGWQFVLGRNIDPDILQSGIAYEYTVKFPGNVPSDSLLLLINNRLHTSIPT